MRSFLSLALLPLVLFTSACELRETEQGAVAEQQKRYEIAQPIPVFSASTERDLAIQLYRIRNREVTTHSVLFGNDGRPIFDCPSYGYGMPYDTSLTNPLKVGWHADGNTRAHWVSGVTEQAEPNGLYSSKNTNATWVFCVSDSGTLAPVYAENLLTVFPSAVKVDYAKGVVRPYGKATVTVKKP